MEQRKLSRTIEKFITEAPNFKKVDELLQYVLHQIIGNEHIGISGGRIWKLNNQEKRICIIRPDWRCE